MWEKIKKGYPACLYGISLILLLGLNLRFGQNWLDSDMAAEMRFSKLLAEEGRLIATPNWYYSTEFRVLYTQLLMGPLFRMIASWKVIRVITNMVFYVLLTGSFCFCMNALGIKKERSLLFSILLLLPFSETVMLHVHMGNTYMSHMILMFLFLGLYFRLLGTRKQGTKWVGWILYSTLAMICGISGVRYLLVLQVPLFVTAFFTFFCSDSVQAFRKKPDRKGWKNVLYSLEGRALWIASAGILGSAAGYAVNVFLLTKKFIFQSYDFIQFITIEEGIFDRIQYALGCMMLMLGYIPDRGVISLRGLVSLSVFFLVVLLGYGTVRTLSQTEADKKMMVLLFPVSLGVNFFVFVFTTTTMVPRYFLPVFILAIPCLTIFANEESFALDRRVLPLLVTACLLLGSAKTVVSIAGDDRNERKKEVAAFLEESGYHFGYATYWNGNILTELTDGKVEIAAIDNPKNLTPFLWSAPMSYFDEKRLEEPVFLLVSFEEEMEWISCKALQNGREIYDDNGYSIYVFDSGKQLFSYAETEG